MHAETTCRACVRACMPLHIYIFCGGFHVRLESHSYIYTVEVLELRQIK